MQYKVSTLADIVYRLRKERTPEGTTQEEFGAILGVSDAYISQIEKGKRTISDNFAVTIADTLGQNLSDREMVLKELRVAISITKCPEIAIELQKAIEEERNMTQQQGEIITPALVTRINLDKSGVKKLTLEKLAKEMRITPNLLSNALDRRAPLSREHIQEMAKALGQNPGEYRLLTGYLPDNLLEVFGANPKLLKAIAHMPKLSRAKAEVLASDVQFTSKEALSA